MLMKRLNNNSIANVFDEVFNMNPIWNRESNVSYTDIYKFEEKEEGLVFEKFLAGIPKENLDLEIKDETLFLKYKVPEKVSSYYSKEEMENRYNLKMYANKLDLTKAEAKLEDGLLKVTIPYLKDKVITKKIKIT